MNKGLNRGQYFGWMCLVGFVGNTLIMLAEAGGAAAAALALVFWMAQMVLGLTITAFRCDDIGINRWWAVFWLVPLAGFYFLFRRGEQYYAAQRK